MPGKRSRQGCEECRKRRRKCDEIKPTCGPCVVYQRACSYKLKLVWGGRKFKKSRFGQCLDLEAQSAQRIDDEEGGFVYGTTSAAAGPERPLALIPHCLPNGSPMPERYRILLDYFTKDILASLSVHPSIHEDLCKGLVPAMLHSPHLLSASLALSAAGFLSRGQTEIAGVDISRVIEHLQSSGLPLLRTALNRGQTDGMLLATCIIWCLAEIFAARPEVSSWRIHLQGVRAILDSNQAYQHFINDPGLGQSAMSHLYQLYLALQTLPHVPSLPAAQPATMELAPYGGNNTTLAFSPTIDGFLGYSQELLDVLHQINLLSSSNESQLSKDAQADILLGKVKGMIARDSQEPPNVLISSVLTPESDREFSLCHRTFQQATLIHIYRKLYKMPSGSQPIQSAVGEITAMVENMAQGQPCSNWVAMAMPLFTVGCEAFRDDQKQFVLDKIHKFDVCLGSLHVGVMKRALGDVWKLRSERGDMRGDVCAGQLLDEVPYSIILF
ncbi:fungal-specific transcription factor domain-containing protein [Mariannaea sp. PMI_226]|nr:fungal-specific transcription factor domain-containing protein [Mariannaea sp. PMI_226]